MTTAICTLALWAIVESACQTYDLPAETVYALIIAESGGDPQAVGALGELGVAQFQETTFKRLASLYETGYQWPQDAIDSEKAVDLLCRALLDEVEQLRAENAAFQEAINDYHADAVEWCDKYNTERERNSRLERSNASNLKACDELKAKLEQTTASLIAECDETAKLRADLAAAKVKIADTTRDLDWYMKAYNRERDEVNSLNCANASNLPAEQPAEPSDGWLAECEAKLASYMADDELRKWVVKYSKRLIAAAREGAMQTSQAYEQIVQLNKSLAAKEADLAAAATREEEAVGALSRLRSLLAAANAKAEQLERERDAARAEVERLRELLRRCVPDELAVYAWEEA